MENYYYFAIFFIILLSPLLLKWLQTSTHKHKKTLPPSPPKLPIIGHLHHFGTHPHHSLLSLSLRHGPIMLLKLGSIPAVVISSAAAAKEIMKTHDLLFATPPASKINRKLFYDLKDISAAPYGEYWRQLKSICVLQLLSNHKVKSFRSVREEEISLMVERIEEAKGKNIPVNLSETFSKLANDVVCRVSLGRKYDEGENGRRFRRLLMEFLWLLGTVNVADFFPWLGWINKVNGLETTVNRVTKEMDEFLEEMVNEKMKEKGERSNEIIGGKSGENFVDILLRIHMSQEAGVLIDRDSVKALILDMLLGGTNTTSTVSEWAMTELIRHPKTMKELQKEVRDIANGKTLITEEDIKNMPYLKAVIKETLRYHTPIPLLPPRLATQDVNVMGYDIAAGTMVFINKWAIFRDPVSWENPDEFKPERFMINCEVDYKGHHFEFIPFGAGRRGCPGISFGIAVSELTLANIVNKFNWVLPDGKDGEDLDVDECNGITVHRKNSLIAFAI